MVKIVTFKSEVLPLSSIWKFVWLKAVKEEQANFKDKFNLRIVTYLWRRESNAASSLIG